MARDACRKENQELFRRGNELLRDAVAGDVSEGKPVPFLCECAEECGGRVEITLSQWESVAREPDHFVMEAGHLRSEGEEFVGSLGDYDVVRKPASR
jgi:hypothetical protein